MIIACFYQDVYGQLQKDRGYVNESVARVYTGFKRQLSWKQESRIIRDNKAFIQRTANLYYIGWMDGTARATICQQWAHDMTSDMNACFMVYISEYLKLRLCIPNFFMAMNPMAGQFLCSYSMTTEPSQNSKISRRHFSSCVSKLNKTQSGICICKNLNSQVVIMVQPHLSGWVCVLLFVFHPCQSRNVILLSINDPIKADLWSTDSI